MNRIAAFLLLTWTVSAGSAVSAQDYGPQTGPGIELIESRIAEIEEAVDANPASRLETLEACKQAIAYLKKSRDNRKAAAEFVKAAKEAPEKIQAIRSVLDDSGDPEKKPGLHANPGRPVAELEKEIAAEQAKETAAEARLALLDAEIEAESSRPAQIRERILVLRLEGEEIAGRRSADPGSHETALLAEAKRWVVDAQLESIQTEVAMLAEELQSHAVRMELNQAQRTRTLATLERTRQRISVLHESLEKQHQLEFEAASSQINAILAGADGKYPLLEQIAGENLRLLGQLQARNVGLDDLAGREHQLRLLALQLAEAFKLTQSKLELRGSSVPVGDAVREQRLLLPTIKDYLVERHELEEQRTKVSLRLLDSASELRLLNDSDRYLATRIERAGIHPPDSRTLARLQDMVQLRRQLLQQSIDDAETYQRRLFAASELLQQLENRTRAYDTYLSERLLWVRSAPAADYRTLTVLPREIADYLDPGAWYRVGNDLVQGLWKGRWPLLLLVPAVLLLWQRRHIRSALVASGEYVQSIRLDRMQFTMRALTLTLLLALPYTLVVLGIAGALSVAETTTLFSANISTALLKTALLLLLASFFQSMSEAGGLAERHFGWDAGTVSKLHQAASWFLAAGIPLYFLIPSAVAMNTESDNISLSLLAFVAFALVTASLLLQILHPSRGVISRYFAKQSETAWWRWRYVWLIIAFAIPVSLSSAALAGYTFFAVEFGQRVILSAWLLTLVWLTGELFRRWLLVSRRRLAYQAVVMDGDTTRARRAGETLETDAENAGETEVDLLSLDADSRQLLNATTVLAVALGLAAIWGGMLPAFRILEDIALWQGSFQGDGGAVQFAVTLGDVIVAVLIGLGGYVLATNLPSLLNIIMLKRGGFSSGTRYAISTLVRYAIVIISTLLVLGRLGANWSQLGWAAAALGVGIGFGLQEIVANFISGLILLAERPVRVGDLITVGDASGTVVRIRIRATTIRDFHSKELLIPNKELITGRLLNWTLSDAMIRIDIEVGIAYGSDVDRAIALLLEMAQDDRRVLGDPPPVVAFNRFGDSSLNLSLRIFVDAFADRVPVTTDMHRNIHRRFAEEGIVIAFPQMDVHFHATQTAEYAGDDVKPSND